MLISGSPWNAAAVVVAGLARYARRRR
ncbi:MULTISPECIES: MprA protease, GlyGly-CTERM protein-sorting domain-containing form [Pseudomonas]